MSKLVAVSYDSLHAAEETKLRLIKLQKEYLLTMNDVVIAEKLDSGKVTLHQAVNLTATGAASGGFWGLLIGMIFLNPLLGVAAGAAGGAIAGALTDVGINDKTMKEIADSLKPGGAILFVLVKDSTGDKVLDGLKGAGGTLIQSSLSHEDEAKLQAALSAARPAA